MQNVNGLKLAVLGLAIMLAGPLACGPSVGSDAWCEDMKNKDKGDWSSNEAADFTKHCVFK